MAKIIYEKDGFKFEKLKDNAFNLSFNVENSKLNLPSLINFDLVKLIYDSTINIISSDYCFIGLSYNLFTVLIEKIDDEIHK